LTFKEKSQYCILGKEYEKMSEFRSRRLFISYCYIPSEGALGFGSCEVEVDYPFRNKQSVSDILAKYFKVAGEKSPDGACVLFWKFYDE
jgi:hypothetical protein